MLYAMVLAILGSTGISGSLGASLAEVMHRSLREGLLLGSLLGVVGVVGEGCLQRCPSPRTCHTYR